MNIKHRTCTCREYMQQDSGGPSRERKTATWARVGVGKVRISSVIIEGIFPSLFVPFNYIFHRYTQPKSVLAQTYSFFSGLGFNIFYENRNLPTVSDKQPKSFLVPVHCPSPSSSVQNMEDSWELVSVPAEIQHSTAGKETVQNCSETSLEKNDGNNKSKVFKIRGKFFNESSIDRYHVKLMLWLPFVHFCFLHIK